MYLKQSAHERRNTLQNGSVPDGTDLASDEDLLGSNFDRISKILPNHELLPDFNGDERSQSQQISPPRRGTDIIANTNERVRL